MKNKTFEVIQIIDDYSIIIDYGSNQGALIGEQVIIVDDKIPVVDPRTGDVIGHRSITKNRVNILEAYDNFSICGLERKETSNILFSYEFPKTVNRNLAKLNVDQSKILENSDKSIKIGDSVQIDKPKG